jgi:hypothetical protein
MEHTIEQNWPHLAPGPQVEDWRVEARQDQGAYGTVYRAVRVGPEHSPTSNPTKAR